MQNIIYDMVEYRKSSDDVFVKYGKDVNQELLNVVIVNILEWLRLEYKRTCWINEGKKTSHKPLLLNYNFPWCKELKKIVYQDERFNYWFCIRENRFDFNMNISDIEKERIREFVFENYNPTELID